MAKRVHDIELKFIASLKDFEAKMAEMPGMTEKEVKKASNRFLKEWQKTQKSLRKVSQGGASKALGEFTDETERASQKLKNFEDSAGEADSILAALGGGLSEISPTAGAFVQGFAEGASVLEATARSGTGLVRILGPLGIAVGAGALAYRELSKGLEEANQKMEAQEEILDEVESMHRAVKEAALLHRLAIGEITEAQFAEISAAQKASDLFGPMLERMNEERSELGATISKEQKALDKATKSTEKAKKATLAYAFGANQMANQNDRSAVVLKNLREQYDALETRIDNVKGAQERYRNDLISTQKTESQKKALETRIDLLEQYEEQLKATSKIIEAFEVSMPELEVDRTAFEGLSKGFRDELETIEESYISTLETLESQQKAQLETAKKLGHDTTQLTADQLVERERLESAYFAARDNVFQNAEKKAQDFIKETTKTLETELETFNNKMDQLDIGPSASAFEATRKKFQGQLNDLEAFTNKALGQVNELHAQQLEATEATGGDMFSLYTEQNAQLLEMYQGTADARVAIEKEANKEQIKNALELVSSLSTIAFDMVDHITDKEIEKRSKAAETIRALLEDEEGNLTKEQKAELENRLQAEQEAADKAFRLQQKAAVAEIIIETALGIAKSIMEFGPIIGALRAIPMGVASGIAIAKVKSQEPPKLHTGGLVNDIAPDEVNARLLRSEMVLNPQGVSTLGRSTVDAANSGRVGGMNQTVVVQWRNRVLDVVTEDVSRRPSPIRSAIRRNRRSGHRRR
jgi:hypothetical protein